VAPTTGHVAISFTTSTTTTGATTWTTSAFNDTACSSGQFNLNGSQPTVTVNAGTLHHFAVTGAPVSTTAGSTFSLTVTAQDAFNNTVTGYTGQIHFSSTDALAVLPANYTFVGGDNGAHTFTNAVTLKTSGPQTVTVNDTTTPAITGTSSTIAVHPGRAVTFSVSAPPSAAAGAAFDVTVTVKDAFDNVVTGYLGTVHFTSTDGSNVLPANYAFQVTDAGAHTFTGGVTLTTAGMQTVTATDTGDAAIHGTSGSIMVSAAAAAAVEYVSPDTSSLSSGSARAFTARVRDSFGNTVTGYVGDITFVAQAGAGTVTG